MNPDVELLDLNLGLDYPIGWSIWSIMRDYVQNFYDALGWKEFSTGFLHEYDENTQVLRMYAREISFSLEYLKYMGASSKRDNPSQYNVGQFGEGFKIASLALYKAKRAKIIMESQDWKIVVSTYIKHIGNRDVEMLCYLKEKRNDDGITALTLEAITTEDYDKFLGVINEFYFPENPLLGPLIEEGEGYAVYEVSAGSSKGHIFASLISRGTLKEIPLILCKHSYRQSDDRDRRFFYSSKVVRFISDIVNENLSADTCLQILEYLQPYWYQPNSKDKNWNYVIYDLIRKISVDKKTLEKFEARYHDKLLIDNALNGDYTALRRKIALSWLRRREENRKLVCSYFEKLNVETLEEYCASHNGFQVLRVPSEIESRYIAILEKIAKDIFSDLIVYESLPTCKIMLANDVPLEGLAHVIKEHIHTKNTYAMTTKVQITRVVVRESLLQKENFANAVATYMHELLHQYGGDSSLQFRKALLIMNKTITQNYELLEKYHEEWVS